MTVTALSAGNSLVDSTKADIFASEESILHALSFVRHSAAPLKEKDGLRDLFLAYAGTADLKEQQEVKAKILQELQSQPELSSLLPKEKPKAMSTVGMSRPVPNFSAAAPVTPAPVVTPTPAPAPVNTEVVEAPVVSVTPPTVETKSEPAPVVPPPPPPTPEPVAVPAAPTTPAPQTPNAKARIDAIKRDINGRVGNPVNLIETDEKVGREYMTALLDAMKRSSRGDNDLTRLETAYQAALTVIKSEPAAISEAPIEKIVTPEMPPHPITPPPPPPVIETPPAPEVVAPVMPVPPSPVPPTHDEATKIGLYHRPEDEVAEEEIKIEREVAPKPVETIKATPVVPPSTEDYEMKMPEVEVKLPPAPPIKSVAKIKVASAEASAPTPTPKPVAPAPTAVKPPAAKPAEVKPTPKPVEETKLRPLNESSSALPEQISKLKSAAATRDEAAKKPITDLKAPEIDQGLRLLLAEWILFKHSGLLFKKPSGIDSPLYKQLAPLPMASVIAGRFEGVTPEIKHTLADYMTGWRYEQGIIHDMGETFENYLRRVVKEILEKQRLTKTAPENSEPKK